MQKQITLRYASKCKRCNGSIPAGASAYWLGAKAGVTHLSCPESTERKPPAEIRKPNATPAGADEMTFDYAELRAAFLKWTTEGWEGILDPRNARAGQHFPQETWRHDSFTGTNIPEMHEWIRNGYHVAGLDGISSLAMGRPRRRIKYGEEGDELLIELVQSGDDNPFMEWEKRISKPGISFDIHANVNSYFPASVLTAFQRWVARALQTLDENGVDMEVNLVYTTRGLLSGNRITVTKVRVRKPGEASDFANWSPMFSPGGFRMLGFTALCLHADRRDSVIPLGLGSAHQQGTPWAVSYDDESGRVAITVNKHEMEFPEHSMTEQLQSVLSKLTGV